MLTSFVLEGEDGSGGRRFKLGDCGRGTRESRATGDDYAIDIKDMRI